MMDANRTKCLFLSLLCLPALPCFCQAVKINYDTKTVAAMAGEYAAAAEAEAYYDKQIKDILGKYNAAEAASAAIFASKFKDRKALTTLGVWNDKTENNYYLRIYSLVSSKLIPMIWDCSGKLLKYPHQALYWGSYLFKVCSETKSLCMQFESVVTNGALSFKDIDFLELNPKFAAFMQLSKFGDVDWKGAMDDLASIPGNFTKENLGEDIGTLYTLGSGLATSGVEGLSSDIAGNSKFNGTFRDKALSLAGIVQDVYDVYHNCDGKVANLFRQYLGNNPTAADLFSFSSYNLSAWMDNYLSGNDKNSYYTQRWYIGRTDSGSETLARYEPPTDDDGVMKGPQWMRYDTGDASFYPDSRQRDEILSNSESYAGWSEQKVDEMNAQDDGSTYSISTSMLAYDITRKNRLIRKAYAYSITVGKSWSHSEEVHEEIFDSYKMDLKTFKMKLQALLDEYNDNEEGKGYRLLIDAPKYYQAADDAKLEGCENVIINMTCTDDVTLGEGATQYKCDDCGGSLNNHSKECSLQTAGYRIPAIMQDCCTAYGVTWQGEGWWSAYTYYRNATVDNIKGTVVFAATLSIARKPQYFMGTKIHRAILKIAWKLSSTFSDSGVVADIPLDAGMKEEDKKSIVNDKLSELATEHPDCNLSAEYVKNEPIENDLTEDVHHLLWASDRLAIARQVESRLMKIYADLVSLNKMLGYKASILDAFKDVVPYINEEQGKRNTIVEECRQRWLKDAAGSNHSAHYNGKYEDTDDGNGEDGNHAD